MPDDRRKKYRQPIGWQCWETMAILVDRVVLCEDCKQRNEDVPLFLYGPTLFCQHLIYDKLRISHHGHG